MINLKTLSLCLSLFFISSTAQAVPFLYIFEGEISSIVSTINDVDQTGPTYNINGANFSVTDSVSYTFIADTANAGSCTPESAIYCDFFGGIPTDTTGSDYFYSELVSASKSVSYGWGNTTLNYGLRQPDVFSSQLSGGSAITVQAQFFGDWDISLWDSINAPLTSNPLFVTGRDSWDETIAGVNYAGEIRSSLTLLSAVALVPAPSTLFLFSIALLIPLVSGKQKRPEMRGIH